MVTFPNAKINLGLHIVRKREDGYHDIETVFYPISFSDVLEITPGNGAEKIQFHQTGIQTVIDPKKNLVYRAADMLVKDFSSIPNISIHLHKAIPAGGGLGGGSSDAAFTLKMLNEKFKLKIPVEKLLDYALQLGSDVPFFIVNKPCFASGRGEFLEPLEIDLSKYKILLVNPGIEISTATAFSKVKPNTQRCNLRKVVTQPVTKWKETLSNDFEEGIFEEYPEIKKIKETMYDKGAVYASMSGSGATVYGIFEEEMNISWPLGYFSSVSKSFTT